MAKEIPPVGEKVIAAGFVGEREALFFAAVQGKLTSNSFEIQGLKKPFYGYFISTDAAIKDCINILFTEQGELLSVVGLFDVKSSTPRSFFYPLQNIPPEKLEAFIK